MEADLAFPPLLRFLHTDESSGADFVLKPTCAYIKGINVHFSNFQGITGRAETVCCSLKDNKENHTRAGAGVL